MLWLMLELWYDISENIVEMTELDIVVLRV